MKYKLQLSLNHEELCNIYIYNSQRTVTGGYDGLDMQIWWKKHDRTDICGEITLKAATREVWYLEAILKWALGKQLQECEQDRTDSWHNSIVHAS